MDADKLDRMRAAADDLQPGQEALDAYFDVLDFASNDEAAANMVGRSLESLDRQDEGPRALGSCGGATAREPHRP